ncbi:hypothetical protein HGRIS_005813 [Hohenbuehelia grisea]|uniref:Uncharacterized protein n=1 Tax=Hohenbuehelia grisea TaxID=104357 RepID=A0ABR3JZ12_9AGAR
MNPELSPLPFHIVKLPDVRAEAASQQDTLTLVPDVQVTATPEPSPATATPQDVAATSCFICRLIRFLYAFFMGVGQGVGLVPLQEVPVQVHLQRERTVSPARGRLSPLGLDMTGFPDEYVEGDQEASMLFATDSG